MRGDFYIVDRIKELIKYKGYQIASAELEACCLTHPDVLDAIVIAVPISRLEKSRKGFIVSRGARDAEALLAWVAKQVALRRNSCARICRRDPEIASRQDPPPVLKAKALSAGLTAPAD